MLRFLQRSKAKKGFTIIELIVVIAIIAVMAAIILPMMSSEKSRIRDARSAASDFYAAVQTVMTTLSLYDAPLNSDYAVMEDSQPGIMRHFEKMRGNYPFDKYVLSTNPDYPMPTSIYIKLHVRNNKIDEFRAVSKAQSRGTYVGRDDSDVGFFSLLWKNPSDESIVPFVNNTADMNKGFGKRFIAELEDRLSFRDGYYYARVDFFPPMKDNKVIVEEISTETVKVAYAAYTRSKLPEAPAGSLSTTWENNNLYFGSDYKLMSGEICGTCAPYQASGTCVGLKGTKLE